MGRTLLILATLCIGALQMSCTTTSRQVDCENTHDAWTCYYDEIEEVR